MKPAALDAIVKAIDDTALREHSEFVDELCENIPTSWDDDVSVESVVVRYVRTLEKRVQELGGSLERFPYEDDPVTAPTDAEWTEDAETAPDPAHLLFVQPPYASVPLDAPFVTIGVTRTFRKFMSVQTARALAVALIRAARFAENQWEDARQRRAAVRPVTSTNATTVSPPHLDVMAMTMMGPGRVFKGRVDG